MATKSNSKKESNKKVAEVEVPAAVIIDGESWTPEVGENQFPNFHNFQTQPVFTGVFVETYSHEALENDAFLFKNDLGEGVLINQHHQIKQAVEKNGTEKKYRIQFKEKKAIAGGRSVNVYGIHTSPLK